MAIRCGNHGREVVYHATVEGVRSCCAGSPVMGVPATSRPKLEIVKPLEVTEGMWRLGERIIKIQIAYHGSGNLYGKELIVTGPKPEDGPAPHEWHRLVGAVRILKEQGGQKLTLAEAVQFGKLYGFCCRCGTILTNEDSIEAGIGPICAGKLA